MTAKKKSPEDTELRPYASSPCYQHELDPAFAERPHADEWASVQHWRRQQRERLIEHRKTSTASAKRRAGMAIIQAIEDEPKLVDRSVAFYWPLHGEVDLRPLMRTFLSRNINVALPVIVERHQALEFWAWEENTPMRRQAIWGIPVPKKRSLASPSVLFIPLVGFDVQGHRLGHGGGYYDRTLATLDPMPLTVGIGYEAGRLTSIYPQDHDIPMDVIVTEKGVAWHNR